MSLIKWATYTVVLALTPVLMRLLIAFLVTPASNARWINEGDVIAFGLILAITNVNGLENDATVSPDWKTKHVGLSLLLIAAFATLFAAACFREIQPDAFEKGRILAAAVALSSATVLYSYAVWDRLVRIRSNSVRETS